jgi:glycosyltransferase involved in cell wall biosynthesis
MLLFDAVFINNSGGKILLDYLIEEIEKEELPVFYLLDARVKGNHPLIRNLGNLKYIKASLWSRTLFYIQSRNRFKAIFCFGNLPPSIRIYAPVTTYFHQQLFLGIPAGTPLITYLPLLLKRMVFRYSLRNTNYLFVQSETVKNSLIRKFGNVVSVSAVPFYPPLSDVISVERKKDFFLYVSSGHLHKNQNRLIRAFCRYFDISKKGELHLTIGNEFPDVIETIHVTAKNGYPIYNHGFVPRNELSKLYALAEYVIYPSLAESFGMGVVEAIDNGCYVIGPDLPWCHAICKPSAVFDPYSENSIFEVISQISNTENLCKSVKLLNNDVSKLIEHLKKMYNEG